MSEVSAAQPAPAATAGALLRQARQARGLHLMALSASLKVPATRLEAMEEDRLHDLPDAAYARALAHTVCRALGIDPQPVLRSLPAASHARLETLDEGLDEPFRETSAAAGLMSRRHRWVVVGLGLGLVLAVALWWWFDSASGALRPAAATEAPRPAASVAVPAPPGVQQEPTPAVAQSPVVVAGSTAVGSSDGLRIVASQPSWVELREAQGQVRLARLLAAGETLELPLGVPASLTVGNAAATAVWVGGQPIDLSGSARENVARIELR